MRNQLLVTLLLSAAAQAQITQLAVNGDGSVLYLNSEYALDGEAPLGLVSRVYKHRPGVPEMATQVDPTRETGPISSIFISDDGQTWAWTTTRVTCTGTFCLPFSRTATVLTLFRNGGTTSLDMSGSISRNGRWIVSVAGCYGPGLIPTSCYSISDFDSRNSRQLTDFNGLCHPTHAITDDGSALSVGNGDLRLYTADGGSPLKIPILGNYRSAAITRDGRKIHLLTDTALIEIDRATLARTEIFSAPDADLHEFAPSSQGGRFLVRAGRDILLITAGTATKVYSAPEDVRQILLTADGQTGIVRTARNRVVQIRGETVEELYAPLPPSRTIGVAPMVPGSLLQMFDGPYREGQKLLVKGVEFPIVAVEDAKLETQIPWDFDRTDSPRYTLRTPGHPFIVTGALQSFNSNIYPTIYYDEKLDDGLTMKAALAGFDSMMSAENPAPAGSTIHFWAMGLGPLDRPLATGERGPFDPPAKPLTPIACYISRPDNVPAVRGLELPFVAYGPGLIGVYQVDATIPADWPSGPASINCALGDQPAGGQARIYVK